MKTDERKNLKPDFIGPLDNPEFRKILMEMLLRPKRPVYVGRSLLDRTDPLEEWRPLLDMAEEVEEGGKEKKGLPGNGTGLG